MKKKTKILISIAVVAVVAVAAWLLFGKKEGQQQQNETLNDKGGSAAPKFNIPAQMSPVSNAAAEPAQVKGENY